LNGRSVLGGVMVGACCRGEKVNIWAEFVFEGQRNDEILIKLAGHDVTGGFSRGGLRSLGRRTVNFK